MKLYKTNMAGILPPKEARDRGCVFVGGLHLTVVKPLDLVGQAATYREPAR